MAIGKLLVSAFVFSVLAAQIWVSFPLGPNYKGWYWPFMDYPMYQRAHYPGDPVVLLELRAEPCATPGRMVPVSSDALALPWFRYWYMLATIAERHPNGVKFERELSPLLRDAAGGPYCAAEVWERRVPLGQQRSGQPSTEWRPADRWALGAS